jgi:hypothetical protein
MNHFAEMIDACRRNLGRAPRQMPPDARRAFRLRMAPHVLLFMWLRGDKLRTVLRQQDLLRDQGRVVWGRLVQANQMLFDRANRWVLPASVIYGVDPAFDAEPALLEAAAGAIFDMKGTTPADEQWRRFAEAITDEMARTMKLALPGALCQGKEAYLTTCLISPAHLPAGYLADGLFPVLICPERTDVVMVLPASYWPESLTEAW